MSTNDDFEWEDNAVIVKNIRSGGEVTLPDLAIVDQHQKVYAIDNERQKKIQFI